MALVTLLALGCSAGDLAISDELVGAAWCDMPGDEVDITDGSETVDKGGRFVVLQGWGVKSKLKSRCFDSEGHPIPCQWGNEPCTCPNNANTCCTQGDQNCQELACSSDTNWGTTKEAYSNIQDRCGSQFSSYDACVLPAGDGSLAGKTWDYYITLSDCPATATATEKTNFVTGVMHAFANIDDDSRITFTKVDAPIVGHKTITVRCAMPSEIGEGISPTGMARGTPIGQLTFEFGWVADPPFQERCADNIYGTLGAGPYSFWTDRVFSYDKALVLFNWNQLWTSTYGIRSCPLSGDSTFEKNYVEYISLHEIGHVFGFPHLRYATSASNVMRDPGTDTLAQHCNRMYLPPQDDAYPEPMLDAISWFSADTGGDDEGTIAFEAISCLKPAGPAL